MGDNLQDDELQAENMTDEDRRPNPGWPYWTRSTTVHKACRAPQGCHPVPRGISTQSGSQESLARQDSQRMSNRGKVGEAQRPKSGPLPNHLQQGSHVLVTVPVSGAHPLGYSSGIHKMWSRANLACRLHSSGTPTPLFWNIKTSCLQEFHSKVALQGSSC